MRPRVRQQHGDYHAISVSLRKREKWVCDASSDALLSEFLLDTRNTRKGEMIASGGVQGGHFWLRHHIRSHLRTEECSVFVDRFLDRNTKTTKKGRLKKNARMRQLPGLYVFEGSRFNSLNTPRMRLIIVRKLSFPFIRFKACSKLARVFHCYFRHERRFFFCSFGVFLCH